MNGFRLGIRVADHEFKANARFAIEVFLRNTGSVDRLIVPASLPSDFAFVVSDASGNLISGMEPLIGHGEVSSGPGLITLSPTNSEHSTISANDFVRLPIPGPYRISVTRVVKTAENIEIPVSSGTVNIRAIAASISQEEPTVTTSTNSGRDNDQPNLNPSHKSVRSRGNPALTADAKLKSNTSFPPQNDVVPERMNTHSIPPRMLSFGIVAGLLILVFGIIWHAARRNRSS